MFAMENRESTSVRFPFLSFTIESPLFMLLFTVFIFGVMFGGVLTLHYRVRMLRRLQRQKRDMGMLKRQLGSA